VCTDAEYQSAFAPPDPKDPKVHAQMLAGYVHNPIEPGAVVSLSVTPQLFDQGVSAILSSRAGPCAWISAMSYDRATRSITIKCDHSTHPYRVEISDGAWDVYKLK
jgi:hypothetical protein